MAGNTAAQGGLLEARIADAARLALAGRKARFVGFLDEREARVAAKIAEKQNLNNVMFWGGHKDAERVFFGAFPDFMEPREEAFPVCALTAGYRPQDCLTHRDFLGALLHAGLDRAAVGDLLVEEGRCVLFCREEVADFLCTQVEKVGGAGVRIARGAQEPYPRAHRFLEFSAVIASARLDCAVAAAAGLSREKAAALIRSKQVGLNHEDVFAPDAAVGGGDVLSVRGKGRFVIDRLGPETKRGKICIAGRKYI